MWQRFRDGLAIVAATIASDDLDLRTRCQLSSCGRLLTIGQQGDNLAALQITNNLAISVITPDRPVVDADDPQWIWWFDAASPDNAQQSVLANR